MTRRILVVGGTGAFGSRLVRSLLNTTDFQTVIAGRDRKKAAALLEEAAPGRAQFTQLDAGRVEVAALRALNCFALVDAAGPSRAQITDWRAPPSQPECIMSTWPTGGTSSPASANWTTPPERQV